MRVNVTEDGFGIASRVLEGVEHAAAVAEVVEGALRAGLEDLLLALFDLAEENGLGDGLGRHVVDVAVLESRLALEHAAGKEGAGGRDAEKGMVAALCEEGA